MHALSLLLAVVAPTSCPERLIPVCDAVIAGRLREAAELAAPLARDPTLAADERRTAVTFAVGGWLQEGSLPSRCAAKALLADYLSNPDLPRTAALERRRLELEPLVCEDAAPAPAAKMEVAPSKSGAGETSPATSPRPSTPLPAPKTGVAPSKSGAGEPSPATSPRPSTPAAPSKRLEVSGMTIGGGALLVAAVGLGAGFAGVVARRDDLADRARAIAGEVLSGGGWTPALEQEREHLLEVDRRMFGAAVGLVVSSGVAAALGVGLVVAGEHRRGRQRAEVVPYGGPQAAGLVLRGRF